ncbi:MAG TPA: hypothetical protein VLE53_09865 [Gemmatimonadaceae bacterium]|nr:hypothetical protein [Gemmatimonadaceae bacterium]
MSQRRTLQEYRTTMPAREVLDAARTFFARRNSIYAAFPEQQSPRHMTFRGQGGEEIALAVSEQPGGTLVTASSYLFDMQISRFFATLPRVPEPVA